ncbi:TrmB family transcriptional regulator [Halostagnicola kamekurae]|uniref:Sugar-specific transcriptional regulator TrmB n=1 Tax=Halostagnicola kamekurae TaxID=619731 RepID=A0A1I6SRR2_9EURY|nr:helix-turn-helix domain-containing protein [Halostagnicola kamekurae]SFS79597.1 Sugar-specific transcriptional regulator TrmB [Halostagnicola kamekurae]
MTADDDESGASESERRSEADGSGRPGDRPKSDSDPRSDDASGTDNAGGDDAPDTDDEGSAVEAFERLGLTGYEAKVFIALHRLGSGTARDVAEITDVPRSQVYSVAENLERRGLLEVNHASPIRYRPVRVEEARETLRSRFEREQDRALEYVERVQAETPTEETTEEIWTVRGRGRVDDRVVDLLSNADERIVFAVRLPALFDSEIGRVLEDRAADGVSVTAISTAPSVRDRLADCENVRVHEPCEPRTEDERSGRIAVVDDDSVLLSVVDDDGSETAIWSVESLFASVLIQLIEANEDTLERLA